MNIRENVHPAWTRGNPGKRAGEALAKTVAELAIQKAHIILYDRKTADVIYGSKFVEEMLNDNPRD